MPTFKRTMQELDGKIAQEQPQEAPKPIEPKQYDHAKELKPKQEKPKDNGYYKDEKGEIYLMRDGTDYYPVGEKERSDFYKGFNEQRKPNKTQRELDTEEHNKIIDNINSRALKMSKEDYWKEIKKEVERFNSVQDKWEDEPKPFGMKKRMEDEVSVHNGQQPKGGQQMPKKDYSYLDDRELYAQINLAENEEEYNDLLAEKERRWQESQKNKPQPKQGSFEQAFGGDNEPRMLYVVYNTPQGQVGDYIELDPDMSEDDIIDQLKENENVVGVYGGATNVGAFDPKWVRE